MIHVNRLTKRYGSLTAIDQVSFDVQAGEVVAFLGPNGAGKSTTMRIITGALSATSGSMQVAGYDIVDAPLEVKRRIGYLPEVPPLYGEMTVLEYLRYAARIKGVARRQIRESIDRTLDRCAIGQVRGRLIGNLSKGYRQRVGLAQALIHDPPVLILDEPTNGLDPKQILEIRELIQQLAGEHTVILSTHILSEATAICQRVIIIHQGRVVAVDTPERLSAQVRGSEQIKVTLRKPSVPLQVALGNLTGVHAVTVTETAVPPVSTEEATWIIECERGRDLREEVANTIVSSGGGLLELVPLPLTLEDVFLQLTADEPARGDATSDDGTESPREHSGAVAE